MIIAHGPLGYLLAHTIRQSWRFPNWYLWFGAIGGMFPDVDLFYFYLVDASVSHHQLITHSLLPYTVLLLLGLSLKPVRWPVTLFALGCISHVLTDVLTGYVAVGLPLTATMIGLPSWQYSLASNSLLEIVIILLALRTIMPAKRWRILSAVSLVLLGGSLIWVSQHSYKSNGSLYYSDADGDGVLMVADRDIDGDGLVNVIDPDIDNDGQDNSVELYVELFAAQGALFDYSFGHAIEVPLRLGLVNDVVLVQRVFANSGLVFSQEMAHDYTARPNGYVLSPTDNQFSERSDNMRNWLQHTQHLLPADAPRQEFDIIFFQSGQVAIFTRVAGADVVLDVHPSHPLADDRPLDEVTKREGGITAIGRINSPTNTASW